METENQVQRYYRLNNGALMPSRVTELNSQAVTQVELPGTEVLRSGARFAGGSQLGSAPIPPQTNIPTTTAPVMLYNAETGGNAKSYVVDYASLFLESGSAASNAYMFWATVAKVTSVPTAAGALFTGSMSGSSKSSKAIWATAVSIPSASVWLPVGTTPVSQTAALQSQASFNSPVTMFLVPPGYGLCLSPVTPAGGSPLFGVSAAWTELELDIE